MAFTLSGGAGAGIVYSRLAALAGKTQMVVSLLVRQHATATAWQSYVNHTSAGNNNGFNVGTRDATPQDLHAFVRNNTESSQNQIGALTVNTWTHLLLNYRGGQANPDRLHIYRNGTLLTPGGLAGVQIFDPSSDARLRIGTWWNSGSDIGGRFDIAELGIWLDMSATAQMIADLAALKAPSFYPDGLHVYAPLLNDALDVQGNAGTPQVTGATITAHPSGVSYPGGGGGVIGVGPTTWIDLVRCTLVDDVLTRTSGTPGDNDAFARTEISFTGDGQFIFTPVQSNKWLRCGLGSLDNTAVPYGFDLGPTARMNPYYEEGGVRFWGPELQYAAGQPLSVQRIGTTLNYYINEAIVWSRANAMTPSALCGRVGFVQMDGAIRAAHITGATTPPPPPPPPVSGLRVKADRLVSPTALGTQSIVGLGFQPKAVLFFLANHGSADTIQDDHHKAFGVAVSPTSRVSGGFEPEDARTASRVCIAQTNTRCIYVPSAEAAAPIIEADLVSMDADGFTLNWTKVWTAGISVFWLALGGDTITDVAAGVGIARTTVGQQDYAVGFRPDCLMSFTFAGSATLPIIAWNFSSSGHIGIATGPDEQALSGWRANTNANPSASSNLQLTNRFVSSPNIVGSGPFRQAELIQILSTGFRLNWETVNTTAARFLWFALQGAQYKVGSFVTAAAAAGVTQLVTGVGFRPRAIILLSSNKAASGVATAHGRLTWGFSDGEKQFSIWGGDRSGVSPTIAVTKQDHDRIFRAAIEQVGVTKTDLCAATLQSFNEDGFTLHWDVANTMGQEVLYLAIGGTDDAPPPPPPPPPPGGRRGKIRRRGVG